MLKRFTLKNYKNFKNEIILDFGNIAGYQFNTDCLSHGMIAKMLIYGCNATGKTNLGKAILDITTIINGVEHYNNEMILNADCKEKAAVFEYEFKFGDTELLYKYSRLSNQELLEEELSINEKLIFQCHFGLHEYHFDHLDKIDASTANIKQYVESLKIDEHDEINDVDLPFLRWLIHNVALTKDSILIELYHYIRRMVMITAESGQNYRVGRFNQRFYESLEDTKYLKDFEDFLNAMGIECQLVLRKLPDGQRELYFDHEKLVPFYENASSGTRALSQIYQRIVSRGEATFIYLDEFDAFYHYEMAENIIRFFKKKYPKCQLVMTSHNTNLMTNRIMRPDCLLILSKKGTLTPLCNATKRELREGHNLEKMYISGEFENYE